MSEREKLELELEVIEETIRAQCELLVRRIDKRAQIKGQLNRARRIEREELQNATQSK